MWRDILAEGIMYITPLPKPIFPTQINENKRSLTKRHPSYKSGRKKTSSSLCYPVPDFVDFSTYRK